MVVVWGNILSLWGNVFAIAVDILVFDAFFPHNDNRKKRWSYILLILNKSITAAPLDGVP